MQTQRSSLRPQHIQLKEVKASSGSDTAALLADGSLPLSGNQISMTLRFTDFQHLGGKVHVDREGSLWGFSHCSFLLAITQEFTSGHKHFERELR